MVMNKKKQKKDKWIDDGRTIAPMNVEGMPWHDRGVANKRPSKENTADKATRRKADKEKKSADWQALQLSTKERRAMIWGGILAILPWALLYAGLFFLAMLFIDYVWLR